MKGRDRIFAVAIAVPGAIWYEHVKPGDALQTAPLPLTPTAPELGPTM